MRLVVLLALCISLPLAAQSPLEKVQDAAPQSTVPFVLHVYANLVQVPALILGFDFKPLPPLDLPRIDVRLDSGPAFHPTQMHIEGNEPLSLTLLLDTGGDQDRLLHNLAPALAALAQSSLSPQDRVSIYAVDCRLIRSIYDAPSDPARLEAAVQHILAAPSLHTRPNDEHTGSTGCHKSLKLWNAVAQTVQGMANLPGRKALVLVSSGMDHSSNLTANFVRQLAGDNSIAIFGLRDLLRYQGDIGILSAGHPLRSGVYMNSGGDREDAYIELCESTGGLIYSSLADDLPASLKAIVTLLRGRYIIEFPRPDDSTPGHHRIDITLHHDAAFIVSAGVSMPLPEAGRATDPTTVPSAASPAVLGKRHPIQ